MSDDRDNVRRRIQGDDDRALRSRVRTPAGGVAARYSPELAGLLVEIERRLSYRVQQVTAPALSHIVRDLGVAA